MSAIDRRTFLQRGARTLGGAALLGIAGPALLEACGSSSNGAAKTTGSSGTKKTAADLGSLKFMGSWIPDVETAGEYVAVDKGYWTSQGFSGVDLIPGGPNATPQETMVATGKAFIAVSSLDSTAAAIEKGLPIVVIGAQYQKNPFAIMSLAKKPLATPKDMIGKKIGVQSDNDAVWAAFLKANNLSKSQVDTVPVSFDPTPLAQGQVDGWFSFITNEPIELGLKGVKTHTFLLADYNYPEVGNAYITTTEAVKSKKAEVVAAMKGDILGWKATLTDPGLGAQLAVKRGQGLSMKEELLQAYAQAKLIATGAALTSGMFYVSSMAQTANCKTLSLGGTHVTPAKLFDMSILDEIYADKTFKAVPTPVLS